MMKFNYLLAIIAITCFSGCQKADDKHRVKEKGFIVEVDHNRWMFFPVEELESGKCAENLATDNLLDGVLIPQYDINDSTYALVQRSFDTIQLDVQTKTPFKYTDKMQVVAVEIEYEAESKFIGMKTPLRSDFSVQSNGKKINFVYDQFPFHVIAISPIFCLNSTKVAMLSTLEVECIRDANDPDNFLYKICEFIKQSNKFSDLPRIYKIVNKSSVFLNKRKVIKVELSCCGTGDVAYFDSNTKKFMSMQFGVK
jgi:hypothetical protein